MLLWKENILGKILVSLNFKNIKKKKKNIKEKHWYKTKYGLESKNGHRLLHRNVAEREEKLSKQSQDDFESLNQPIAVAWKLKTRKSSEVNF